MANISSARGILSLLRETDTAILTFALKRLNEVVDVFWYEVSSDIALIEELYEAENLLMETRQLAALIAARVFFHLGEYSESVNFALAAGPLFNAAKRSLFIDTILSRCIDLYVAHREKEVSGADMANEPPLDPRLDALFMNLAQQWQAADESHVNVKELVGFCVRARRLDLLEVLLRKHLAATNSAEVLTFTMNTATVLVRQYNFRRQILEMLSKLFHNDLNTVDYFSLAQCLIFLGDAERMAQVLHGLLSSDENKKGVAYQLGFDLFEFAGQEFLVSVATHLKALAGDGAAEGEQSNINSVLSGELTTSLYVKFLYARCNADIHVLNHLKKSIDSRNSILHNATVLANGLMYSGTTIDSFLRENMEWLSRANQWAKFTASATVGAIHKGHTAEAMTILKAYLPTGSVGPLPFHEAGALYALGLIHGTSGASTNESVVEYLRKALQTYGNSEQMVHGASLGLGLAAMGRRDEDLFESLFACVSGCDAVAGEAAAVAIGCNMLGSGNERVLEALKRHAMENDQKEKTIRGISMGMALTMLGREDDSLPLVEELLAHADPWVRLGGVFVLGLAFAGTSHTKAIQRLLEVSVRDVSDDVRRNAVTMIGFVSFKDPALCLEMTKLLADSYNPHIRYGVALALGIAAAGTARQDVVDLLWTLKNDVTDFVRQGSFIALSMVLVQATEKEVPLVKEMRQMLSKKIADRKEDVCTKFGCIIATGLLDAGGRNTILSLHKQRHRLDKAVVGMFLFSQHWFWFPYTLMISLSMQPTCVIALNEQLQMPNYTFQINAPPSQFALPKSVVQEKKEAKAAGVRKVELSTTKKAMRDKKKRQSVGGAELERSTSISSPTTDKAPALPRTDTEATDVTATTAVAPPAEPTFEQLQNPARVTHKQWLVASHNVDARYQPLKANPFGVCILKDNQPDGGEEKGLVTINPMDRDDDAPVPQPFDWP